MTTHGVARDQLRVFVERIERLSEEKKTIEDDIKDVLGEAKSMGFCTKTLKKIVALRKKDENKRAEEEAILDTYKMALGMIPQLDMFDRETGEVFDGNASAKLVATVATGMQTEAGRAALVSAVDVMIAREEAETMQNQEEMA